RYGARQLKLAPGFTTVAILSLALGIGANTAMFQLIDAVRLRTLPVERPQELVTVDFAEGSTRDGWFSTRSARMTYANWQEIRQQQRVFSTMGAWSATNFNLASGGQNRPAEGLFVSGDFYKTLGVEAIIGRTIVASDDRPGCGEPGAVLSYSFWQREFGGRADVLGRTIRLNARPFPIIGVTPSSFFGVEVGRSYDIAIPLCADALFGEAERNRLTMKHAYWIAAMGRLLPGQTAQSATAQLRAISPAVMQATLPPNYKPDTAKRYLNNKLEAAPGSIGVSGLRQRYERPLWMLLATTGLVLLIACANLANLLLARAAVRARELAVKLAIGASRARLVRQLLAESLLLSITGAVLGAILAQALSRGLVRFLTTENTPLFVNLAIDGRILAFTSGIALITCLLFGLMPAWRATAVAPSSAMRSGGRGTTAGRERFGMRRALVATQVALSLVLLTGALLFVRSLHNLMNAEIGFRTEGLMTVSVSHPQRNLARETYPVIQRSVLEKLKNQPGVVSAAQVAIPPISGSGWNDSVGPDNTTAAGSGKVSFFNRVSPGYFATVGARLLSGRDFRNSDHRGSPEVAVVNAEFAKRFFGGGNPVGRTFRTGADAGKPEPLVQVIGVVENTKYYTPREDFLPIAHLAVAQEREPGPDATFILRASGSVAPLLSGIKAAAAEVSPSLGLEFRFISQQLQESLMRERLMATLSGAFGLLAGLLATLGLYGVIAYTVERRRSEIGLRMALGADRRNVIALVLKEALLLLAVGAVVGTGLAVWSGQAAATLLYGMKPHDPGTLAVAIAVLSAIALAASYGPARKAAALDPMNALREE
ncbi:MAG TPA: ABC transporter permease, partial [Bryobacteraceae bacterium]|nr:ABC transporter permease [Bryobacteraceae bacterium]